LQEQRGQQEHEENQVCGENLESQEHLDEMEQQGQEQQDTEW
jgi:hypothetical protein